MQLNEDNVLSLINNFNKLNAHYLLNLIPLYNKFIYYIKVQPSLELFFFIFKI